MDEFEKRAKVAEEEIAQLKARLESLEKQKVLFPNSKLNHENLKEEAETEEKEESGSFFEGDLFLKMNSQG